MKKIFASLFLPLAVIAAGMTAISSPANAASPTALDRFQNPDYTAKPMARMWFSDASAGIDPNDTIEKQILSLAEAGFGGVEVAMLNYGASVYSFAQLGAVGWGTPNWNKTLKKIYKAAAKVDGGFRVDITISGMWPPNVNTLDPNDPEAAQETATAFTPLTSAEIGAGQVTLARPAVKSRDGSNAPFIFTDTLISGAVAKVTAITVSGSITKYTLDFDSIVVLTPTQTAAYAAGVPDATTLAANPYGTWGSVSATDLDNFFGVDPGAISQKIDPTTGARKRLADTQYDYTIPLSGLDSAVQTAISGQSSTIAVGDYVGVGIYTRGTGQNWSFGSNNAPLMTNRPYVPDYFDADGIKKMTDYWDANIFSDTELAGLIAANPGSIFEDSIEATPTTSFWTVDAVSKLPSGYAYTAEFPIVAAATRPPGGFGGGSNDTIDLSGSVTPQSDVDRLSEDYNALFGKLYIDEHVTPVNTWAASHGMTFRSQTYDLAGMDIGAAASTVEIPEGDNMTKGDGLRRLSAANNLNDKKYLSMEAVTGGVINRFNWEEVMFELTSNYSWGVNRAILHGTPYSKSINGGVIGGNSADWPGWDAFGASQFGESYTYRQPYWDAETQVTDYLARIQALMQYSTQKIDVAVMQEYELAFENPSGNAYQDLLDAGYSYNLLTDGMLASANAAIVGNKQIYPAGPGYKAVVLDQVNELSLTAMDQLLAYANAGVTIVLLNCSPATARVYGTNGGQDATLQAKYTTLASLPSVVTATTAAALPTVLAAAGVKGYAQYSIPKLETTAYQDSGNTYYYLYNDVSTFQGFLGAGSVKGYKDTTSATYGPPIVNPTVTLQGTGTPYILDPFTGAIEQAGQYTVNSNGTVTVRLDTIKGGSATIVALSTAKLATTGTAVASVTGGTSYSIDRNAAAEPVLKAQASGTYTAKLADGKSFTKALTVPAAIDLSTNTWNLVLDSYGPKYANASTVLDANGIQYVDPSESRIATEDLGTQPLAAWGSLTVPAATLTAFGVPSMNNVSGRGYYSTTFNWTSADTGAVLELGYLNDQITGVVINGTRITVGNLADAVDVGDYLKVGSNTLVVELTSTLNHRAAYEKGTNPYSAFIVSVPSNYLDNGLVSAKLVPYTKLTLVEPKPTPTPTTTVKQPTPTPTYVTKVKFGQSKVTLVKGKSVTIRPGVYFSKGAATYTSRVTYKSSNTKVAKVDAYGNVKALKAGTAKITATSKLAGKNGKKLSATYTVTVVKKGTKTKVTKLTLPGVPKTLKVGQTLWLTASYTAKGNSKPVKVTYTSLQSGRAGIDSVGRLTGVSKGKDTIVVKAGGKTVKYTITVK